MKSYLDGIVLDRQIYWHMYQSVKEAKNDPSYQEILYLMYRDSFKPYGQM